MWLLTRFPKIKTVRVEKLDISNFRREYLYKQEPTRSDTQIENQARKGIIR